MLINNYSTKSYIIKVLTIFFKFIFIKYEIIKIFIPICNIL